jgi:hypothetical protein
MMAGMASQMAASSLEVYRDGAFYRYTPKEAFVGFVGKGARALCKEVETPLVTTLRCPERFHLCQEKTQVEALEAEAGKAMAVRQVLQKLVDRSEPDEVDVEAFFEKAEKIGERLARLEARHEKAMERARLGKEAFLRRATAWEAAALPEDCMGEEVALKFPAGWVGFDLFYEAEVGEKGSVGITQKMHVTNRSGVDIEADTAHFFHTSLSHRLRPLRFTPWVVRDARHAPRRVYRKGVAAMEAVVQSAPAVSMGEVSVERPRHYLVKKLSLPSSGKKVTVLLSRWREDAEYGERVYPYRDGRVYETVRFAPSRAIDADRWRVYEKGRLKAADVYGAYLDGRYTLFLGVDEEVAVHRDRLYLKEKESFFGDTVKKRDGYEIALVNESDSAKRLTVVDRIPVAQRSDVKVKLLRVASKLPLRYELGPQGKLEMGVTLPPHGGGSIEVLFEVSHDKDKPVRY